MAILGESQSMNWMQRCLAGEIEPTEESLDKAEREYTAQEKQEIDISDWLGLNFDEYTDWFFGGKTAAQLVAERKALQDQRADQLPIPVSCRDLGLTDDDLHEIVEAAKTPSPTVERLRKRFDDISREWILKAADAEDQCGGIISVGGWAVDNGMYRSSDEIADNKSPLPRSPALRDDVELSERDVDIILNASRAIPAVVERLRQSPYVPPSPVVAEPQTVEVDATIHAGKPIVARLRIEPYREINPGLDDDQKGVSIILRPGDEARFTVQMKAAGCDLGFKVREPEPYPWTPILVGCGLGLAISVALDYFVYHEVRILNSTLLTIGVQTLLIAAHYLGWTRLRGH